MIGYIALIVLATVTSLFTGFTIVCLVQMVRGKADYIPGVVIGGFMTFTFVCGLSVLALIALLMRV